MSSVIQAITGVSSGTENVIMTVYPSISGRGLGQLIGLLMNSVPLRIGGVRLSNLVFGLPLAPLGAIGYLAEKVIGDKYILTNRSVEQWKATGGRMLSDIPLESIASIELDEQWGQDFYYAADLLLVDAKGTVLTRLKAVTRPDVFRQTILEARDARMQVTATMELIQARKKA